MHSQKHNRYLRTQVFAVLDVDIKKIHRRKRLGVLQQVLQEVVKVANAFVNVHGGRLICLSGYVQAYECIIIRVSIQPVSCSCACAVETVFSCLVAPGCAVLCSCGHIIAPGGGGGCCMCECGN